MDFKKIILGEGKLVFNHGETGAVEVGYVRGATFTENLTIRHIQVDGKKGNVKGDAIIEEVIPTLEVNMMEIISTEWEKAFGAVTVDATTPATTKITRNLVVADTDYLINVAYIGATKEGKAVIVKILNALGEGGMNLSFADKAEVEIPVSFIGHYTDLDDTTAPFEIIVDESVA